MIQPDPKKVRRARRIQIANGQEAWVSLEQASGSSKQNFTARLVDISRYGCKLALPSRVTLGEAIRLGFTISELALEMTASAEVCWARPAEDSDWFLGCSFIPELPEDACNQLGSSGLVERRRQLRREISINASATWEQGEADSPVTVRDYSRSGFCMLTDNPGTTGRLLTLYLNEPQESQHAIPARAQWTMKLRDNTFIVGCSILNWQEWDFMDASFFWPTDELPTDPQVPSA